MIPSYVPPPPLPSDHSNQSLELEPILENIYRNQPGIFVLISVATNLSIAPLTPIYMAEWDKSLSQVALLVCFLP
jgi:hypothetical protein